MGNSHCILSFVKYLILKTKAWEKIYFFEMLIRRVVEYFFYIFFENIGDILMRQKTFQMNIFYPYQNLGLE